MIELNIIAAFYSYENARVFLPQTNPLWFTDPFNQSLVKAMKDLYQTGDVISVNVLMDIFKDNKKQLAKLFTAVISTKTIERDLKILEIKYKHKQILTSIQTLQHTDTIESLQNKLAEILEQSKIEYANDIANINIVAGDVLDNIHYAIERGDKLQGISTGWRYLDKYIGGYHKGNLIVIGGRPGAGKSALGLSLAIDCCKWTKVLFVTLEMSKEELAQRYISYKANIENYRIRNANMSNEDIESITHKLYAEDINIDIMDSHNRYIDHIITHIKLHKAKYGLNIVFIDYLQLLDVKANSRYEKVSEVSKRLKQLAKEENITIIALAQLRREDRVNVRPTLSDLKESGQIEQDADVVLFPYRPQYYESVRDAVEMDAELILAKNRHGQCADIPISFEGRYTRYKERL